MELIFITTMLEVLILVIILAIFFTATQLIYKKIPYAGFSGKKKLAKAVEALAVVLTMEETGVFMNQQPLIKMQMQVIPDKGRNFVVEVRELLSHVDRASIRSGSTVKVKYNPANLRETMLVRVVD